MSGDSQEEIRMCLNCPRPECIDCLGRHEGGNGASTRRLLKVRKMAEEGMTDAQMASVLGCHANTILEIRKVLGVPNYRTRKYGIRTA